MPTEDRKRESTINRVIPYHRTNSTHKIRKVDFIRKFQSERRAILVEGVNLTTQPGPI